MGNNARLRGLDEEPGGLFRLRRASHLGIRTIPKIREEGEKNTLTHLIVFPFSLCLFWTLAQHPHFFTSPALRYCLLFFFSIFSSFYDILHSGIYSFARGSRAQRLHGQGLTVSSFCCIAFILFLFWCLSGRIIWHWVSDIGYRVSSWTRALHRIILYCIIHTTTS
ncbi:hypothetical protein IQ07DRAFT_150810 [Pyrenochaeta sp. DS3sAY3a]|nr:hypothetical protein IQ07DRAFT_150810 [Pyrenochaeta sp. DS3sAY3a]